MFVLGTIQEQSSEEVSNECHSETENNGTIIESGIYSCQFCSYVTFQKISFENHQLSHSDERPFKCAICSKGFTQKHNLQYHILIHQNLKPFKCEICKQGFRQSYSLKLHKKKYNH